MCFKKYTGLSTICERQNFFGLSLSDFSAGVVMSPEIIGGIINNIAQCFFGSPAGQPVDFGSVRTAAAHILKAFSIGLLVGDAFQFGRAFQAGNGQLRQIFNGDQFLTADVADPANAVLTVEQAF